MSVSYSLFVCFFARHFWRGLTPEMRGTKIAIELTSMSQIADIAGEEGTLSTSSCLGRWPEA